MENGISISMVEDGLLIDGEHMILLDDADDIVSEYFFPEYWEDHTCLPSEGEISKNSLFIKFGQYAPAPCCSGFTLFTFCNNPKFAAGLLKCSVLAAVCECLLSEDSGSDDDYDVLDIDEFVEDFTTNDSEKKDVFEKLLHIIRLCNLVFIEQNKAEQKKHLFYAAEKFKEYFPRIMGWDFIFDVYDGIENAKDEILSYMGYGTEKDAVSEILSKDEWTDEEKDIIMLALSNIVG